MKKSNFTALILGTVGGIFFALGMCMTLAPELGADQQKGILCGVIGLAVLAATLLIWRRMEHKAPIKLDGKTVGAILMSVAGALLLGVGMCLTMVFHHMVPGIVVGIVGIVVLLMLIPLVKGVHD